jgi:Holliday junction resolvasome RuvABC endonuclease subunit
MKIIALDVSGSATGWAYAVDHTLKDYGKFISNLRKTRGERLYDFALWLDELFTKYKPDVVLIEKPYLGRNSNVLANLSKFIAVVELMAFQALDLEINQEWFIDPKQVKKLLGLPRSKKGKTSTKYIENKAAMVKRINSLYGLKLKYVSGKTKRHNDDDIADAIAVLAAWLKMS